MEELRPETWIKIEAYPSYSVSSWCRIKNNVNNLVLAQSTTSSGYQQVTLYEQGRKTNHRVHRLVADAFLGSKSNDLQVNHVDGNKYNNSAENLEWVTASENSRHAFAHGLRTHTGGSSKQKVLIVELNMVVDSQVEAAKAVNGLQGGVSNVLRGSAETHKGYHFRYVKE